MLRAARLLAATPPQLAEALRGVIHCTAVVNLESQATRTILVGPRSPPCADDLFVLCFCRSLVDLTIQTGANLRDEPHLLPHWRVCGGRDADALTRERASVHRKPDRLDVLVLTRSPSRVPAHHPALSNPKLRSWVRRRAAAGPLASPPRAVVHPRSAPAAAAQQP